MLPAAIPVCDSVPFGQSPTPLAVSSPPREKQAPATIRPVNALCVVSTPVSTIATSKAPPADPS